MKVTNKKLKKYINSKEKFFGFDADEIDLKVSENKILLNGISLDEWHKMLWRWLSESIDREKMSFSRAKHLLTNKQNYFLRLMNIVLLACIAKS